MFGEFLEEIKQMNQGICERLDLISTLIDDLIVAVRESQIDNYGDGR